MNLLYFFHCYYLLLFLHAAYAYQSNINHKIPRFQNKYQNFNHPRYFTQSNQQNLFFSVILPSNGINLHRSYNYLSDYPFHRRLKGIDTNLYLSSLKSKSTSENNLIKSSYSLSSVLETLTLLFPLWVMSFSISGWFYPILFQWFTSYITPSLSFVMFSMGLTLTLDDFKAVANNWRYVLIGFIAQYSIMPLLAWSLSKYVFTLPIDLAIGLILVGCSPGGTASNLVTMIAKSDIALSVLMTTVSTIAAILMTPLLITKFTQNLYSTSTSVVNMATIAKSGSNMIKISDLIVSVMNVVLIPVILGLGCNSKYPKTSTAIATQYAPILSVLLVALICGTVTAAVSASASAQRSVASIILPQGLMIKLLGAIVCLHSFGFLFGYLFAKVLKADESSARTISIETGMQNSALASVLAQHFPNPLLSALPGALSATCHSVIGSMLAAIWRRSQSTSDTSIDSDRNKSNDPNPKPTRIVNFSI